MIGIIFEIEHSLFWLNTSWSFGEESNQYHAQDLLAEKTLPVTLSNISSCSEVSTSSYLTLWKTTKEQAEEQDTDKLGKRSVRKVCRQKWWQHYVYQENDCALCGTYVQAIGKELYLNDLATTQHNQHRFMLELIPTFRLSSTCYTEAILKTK